MFILRLLFILPALLDVARQNRLKKMRKKRLEFLLVKCACIIQKVYRARRGRLIVLRRRNSLANERLKKAKIQARIELLARTIQRIVRGHAARRKVRSLPIEKRLFVFCIVLYYSVVCH